MSNLLSFRYKKYTTLESRKHEVNLPSEQRDLLFNFHGRHPGFGPSYYKDNVVRGKIIDIFTGLVLAGDILLVFCGSTTCALCPTKKHLDS